MLYADVQMVLGTSEDELKTMTSHLTLEHKNQMIDSVWNHIQTVKTDINGNPTEHISDCKYTGYLTLY